MCPPSRGSSWCPGPQWLQPQSAVLHFGEFRGGEAIPGSVGLHCPVLIGHTKSGPQGTQTLRIGAERLARKVSTWTELSS